MTDLSSGTVIAGRYRLDRLLGEGGMGAVWAATDTSTSEGVALKFMKGLAAVSPLHHKRFYREARAAMAVKHPNVVRIHEVVRGDDGAPVMVMDLLAGESLHGRLSREGALALPTFARLFLPVVSAVGTAHAVGIVHRDLKPDNIFLQKLKSGDIEVRVLDFGIAKLTATEGDAAQTAGLTSTGSMMGTPYYMPPEQVFGEKDLDHRADIWALGVIMYEALAGQRPIEGENIGQLFKKITTGDIVPLARIAPHLPADVAELTMRMLSVDRTKRPEDLREVQAVIQGHTSLQTIDFGAATLAANLSDYPSEISLAATAAAPALAMTELATGSPLSHSQVTEPPKKRRPLVVGAVVAAVVGIGGVGGTLYLTRSEPTAPGAAPSALESSPTTAKPSATQVLPAAATSELVAPAPSASVAPPSSGSAKVAKTAKSSNAIAPSSAPSIVPTPAPVKSAGVGGIGTAAPF